MIFHAVYVPGLKAPGERDIIDKTLVFDAITDLLFCSGKKSEKRSRWPAMKVDSDIESFLPDRAYGIQEIIGTQWPWEDDSPIDMRISFDEFTERSFNDIRNVSRWKAFS